MDFWKRLFVFGEKKIIKAKLSKSIASMPLETMFNAIEQIATLKVREMTTVAKALSSIIQNNSDDVTELILGIRKIVASTEVNMTTMCQPVEDAFKEYDNMLKDEGLMRHYLTTKEYKELHKVLEGDTGPIQVNKFIDSIGGLKKSQRLTITALRKAWAKFIEDSK